MRNQQPKRLKSTVLGLEGQGDQGFNPECLEPDPESEPMFPHRSTPSVAEAAGPFPAAVRIRRVENLRYAHRCLHAAGVAATIAVSGSLFQATLS